MKQAEASFPQKQQCCKSPKKNNEANPTILKYIITENNHSLQFNNL